MRVAVPIWQGRVSPVFDVAERVLLVEYGQGGEVSRHEEAIAEQSPDRRVARLAELGVGTLICCGISRPLEMLLIARGIEVIPRICGDVEEVLQAYRAGSLSVGRFAMPGCCRRRRGRGGGMGRGRCGRGKVN